MTKYKVTIDDAATEGNYSVYADVGKTNVCILATESATAGKTALNLPLSRYNKGNAVFLESATPITTIWVEHVATGTTKTANVKITLDFSNPTQVPTDAGYIP
jgi:hypothetical protein